MGAKMDQNPLKDRLSKIQWQVTQEKGTEKPFTGQYNQFYEQGIYQCIVCAENLFDHTTKYDSGSGWPAFYKSIDQSVKETQDYSHCMSRVEVTCAQCNAHLGHVFDDGPSQNGGLRYCINSASLQFEKYK